MIELIMDVKLTKQPYHILAPLHKPATQLRGEQDRSGSTKDTFERKKENTTAINFEGVNKNKVNIRPIANKTAIGLNDYILRFRNAINEYAQNYIKNIEHTCDHKIVFSIIEKKVLGRNSINSVTHDLDKLILYMLGFSRGFVTKVHRQFSEHHIENNKIKNLNSMLCDHIASSPEFKPEKRMTLKEFFNSSKDLQQIEGYRELLEEHHFGEDLDFEKIKNLRDERKKYFKNVGGFIF